MAAIVFAVLLAPVAQVGAAESVTVERLSGATRYETAAAIGEEYADVTAGRSVGAILTRGDDFADSLAASNLHVGVPLLTERDRLHPAARWVIAERGITGVRIVGGHAAVARGVEDELVRMGVSVTRIAGTNRYDTAAKTYTYRYGPEMESPEAIDGMPTAFLASGENYPDALAAAPVVAAARLPLFLTRPDSLPEETKRILASDWERCPNGVCIEQIIILGGTSAVGTQVEAELRALGLSVRRIAGVSRQETAVEFAEFARDEVFPDWPINHFNLARGDAFPDALAGGRLGEAERAVTLITENPTTLGAATERFLRENASTITSFHVLGDESAVSPRVVEAARSASTSTS